MKFLIASLFMFVLLGCQLSKKASVAEASAPKIILKLDDLKQESNGEVHPGWNQVIALLDAKKIPASIGLICSSLEDPSPAYLNWIAVRKADGHELWNHGFCHCQETLENGDRIREFRGKSYEAQLAALVDGQRLAQEKLGFELKAFGAPYNNTDSATAAAILEIPALEYWIYKETDYPTSLIELKRTPVNIEYPVHIPNLDSLQYHFEEHRTESVLVIQGHPRSWIEQPENMQTFAQIIEYLKEQGCEFVRIEDL